MCVNLIIMIIVTISDKKLIRSFSVGIIIIVWVLEKPILVNFILNYYNKLNLLSLLHVYV